MANSIIVGNYYTTTLAAPLGVADTTLNAPTLFASNPSSVGLPTIVSPASPLIVTLTDGNFYEIIELSYPSGEGIWQFVRGTEGTAARAWPVGTEVSLRITAEVLRHASAGTIENQTLKDPSYYYLPRISKHVIPVDNVGNIGAQVDTAKWDGAYIARAVYARVITEATGAATTVDAPAITITTTTSGSTLASVPAATALPLTTASPFIQTGITASPQVAFYPSILGLDVPVNNPLTESPVISLAASPVIKDGAGTTLSLPSEVVVAFEYIPIR